MAKSSRVNFSAMSTAEALDFARAHLAECAQVGLDGKSVKEINAIAKDLLRSPSNQGARGMKLHENQNWLGHCLCLPQLHPAFHAIHGAALESALWGKTASAVASSEALIPRMRALGKRGADFNSLGALRSLCEQSAVGAALWLIEQPGININPVSAAGTPLLHRLAYNGPNELLFPIASRILKADPQAFFQKDPRRDQEPLMWALRAGSTAMGRGRFLLDTMLAQSGEPARAKELLPNSLEGQRKGFGYFSSLIQRAQLQAVMKLEPGVLPPPAPPGARL